MREQSTSDVAEGSAAAGPFVFGTPLATLPNCSLSAKLLPMNRFGEQLRYWREQRALSQGNVARRLGVSVTYLSDVERGQRAPLTEERILSVARLLDVSPSVFMDARAEHDGFWRIPVCQTPQHDRLASFFAATWKDLTAEQLAQVEAIFARQCEGCSSTPPGKCYSEK